MRNRIMDLSPTVTRRTWATSLVILAFGACVAAGYAAEPSSASRGAAPAHSLSTFVIEREIPGAGKWSPDDKVYCVYEAPNKELIRRHAAQAGFPANRISEVRSIINLGTAQ